MGPHNEGQGRAPGRRLVCIAVGLLVAASVPAVAVDSVAVGFDSGSRNWRSIADWSEVRQVTVAYDSVFKWDVRPNDNLSARLLSRGGLLQATYQTVEEDSIVEVTGPLPGLESLIDGDGSTAFDPDHAGETGVPRNLRIVLDLGAVFSINRIRLHPRLDDDNRVRFPQQFAVGTSVDGASGPFAVISGLNFGPLLPNAEPIVDRVFTSREARFVQIHTGAVQPWELAEVEVYSDGTIPVGQYQSVPLSARHTSPVWGRVRYEGGDITKLPVVMQTRTGPDRTPVLYYRYTGVADNLVEVPLGQWAALLEEERGPVRPNPEWTEWSTVSDGIIRVVALHRYVQFRLRFSEPGTTIRRLILEYSRPALVQSLQAEVSPRLVAAGEEREFTLSVLSHTIANNPAVTSGFRQLEVRTTAHIADVDRVLVDDVDIPFSTAIRPGQGFTINLGRRIAHDGAFLQARFRGAVFRDATRFEARAVERRFTDGQLDSVYQVAVAGDIDIDVPGGELVVRLEEEGLSVIDGVTASPAVISVNGDGVNDAATIGFDLYKLTRAAAATVEIYDLAGRRIRQLWDGDLAGGHHAVTWRGDDDSGRPVSPGTYLYRIRLEGDEATVTRQGLLGVVY